MKISLIYAYWPNQPDGITWCDLPWALRDKGLAKRLHGVGHEVVETMLMAEGAEPDGLRAGLELAGEIAGAVREAVAEDELAVVLAGSCALAAIGAVGGLGGDTGIAWFDAHPDLETPETTVSGLVEGMALAAVTGHAWRAMVRAHGSLGQPASLENVMLFGARDISPDERRLIDASGIVITSDAGKLVRHFAGRGTIYAHLDMDVHDPQALRTRLIPTPGGPDIAAVRSALSGLVTLRGGGRGRALNCLSITGLDPAMAGVDKAIDVAIEHVLAAAGGAG